MKTLEHKKILEAVLLCANAPLSIREMSKIFNEDDRIEKCGCEIYIFDLLNQLQIDWSKCGLALIELSCGWRFQSRIELKVFFDRLNSERPAKYSRAVFETLAVIAYRQPVTRGDIEEIRGVTVNSQTIKFLEERNWIESVGQRDLPGRPLLFATTNQFLDELDFTSLKQLPLL